MRPWPPPSGLFHRPAARKGLGARATSSAWPLAMVLYRVAIKELFYVAAGFSLRLHRRDACATL